MPLELQIPASKTTWAAKLAFAHAAQKVLTEECIQKAQDEHDGIISAKEWKNYDKNIFHPQSLAISTAIGTLKNNPPPAEVADVHLKDHFKSD